MVWKIILPVVSNKIQLLTHCCLFLIYFSILTIIPCILRQWRIIRKLHANLVHLKQFHFELRANKTSPRKWCAVGNTASTFQMLLDCDISLISRVIVIWGVLVLVATAKWELSVRLRHWRVGKRSQWSCCNQSKRPELWQDNYDSFIPSSLLSRPDTLWFLLFPKLKSVLRECHFGTTDDIKTNSLKALHDINKFSKTVKCVKRGGEYSEKSPLVLKQASGLAKQ